MRAVFFNENIIGTSGKDFIFITRDKRIRTKPEEVARLMNARVRAFVVTVKRNLQKSEMYQLIDGYSESIIGLDLATTPPYIYAINTHSITRYR